jgi:hypothetical protein
MAERNRNLRGVAFVSHGDVHEGETQPLLRDAEEADDRNSCFPPQWRLSEPSSNPHADLPVYDTIHR